MIDLREFYKDYYDQTLERKNEINNSLSMPLGIVTALIAALFYALTNFDLQFNVSVAVLFAAICFLTTLALACSIYYLIKAFSDFHDGYDYAYIANANIQNEYYETLLLYYNSLPDLPQSERIELAKSQFNIHLMKLFIDCASINQGNNARKTLHKYRCHEYIIYTIIMSSLLYVLYLIKFVFIK